MTDLTPENSSEDQFMTIIEETAQLDYKIKKMRFKNKKIADYISYLKTKINEEERRLGIQTTEKVYLDCTEEKLKVKDDQEVRSLLEVSKYNLS